MHFEPSYFCDEVREGFYIPGMVKRSWAVQMDVLEVVSDICKRANIQWFADCGTLIGTIRHGGFIPWDDDLDICMLRDDYEKFISIVDSELPADYTVLNLRRQPEYEHFLTRIVSGTAINISTEFLNRHRGFPYTAGIDIFPLDYLYSDNEVETKRRDRALKLWKLTANVMKSGNVADEDKIRKEAEMISGYRMPQNTPLLAALRRTIEKIMTECPKEGAEYVALMPYWIQYANHKYPISCFAKMVTMPFENTLINVPASYDEVLKIEYGQWECVNRKGGVHDYPFYSQQQNILIGQKGSAPYLYPGRKIPDKDLGLRKMHKLNSDDIGRRMIVLSDASDSIRKLISMRDYEALSEFLNMSQQLAISIGNAIEERYAEAESITNNRDSELENATDNRYAEAENAKKIVEILEQYCETVYLLNEAVIGCGGNIDDLLDALQNLATDCKEAFAAFEPAVKSVVLLPVLYKDWKYMEPVYRKFKGDEAYKVYVAPLPYALRNDDGTPIALLSDESSFSNDIELINYNEIDWNSFHADIIVIQNPYDSYESGMTVLPDAYCAEIWKYTDRLIYCPCVDTGKISPDDGKALANVDYYAITPGVLYADEAILRDPDEILLYQNALKGHFGEDEYKKLQVEFRVNECPVNVEKTTHTGKKKLLFYMSFADLYSRKDVAIAKLHKILQLFDNSKDSLEIMWLMEDDLRDNIRSISGELEEAFDVCAGHFCDARLGTLIGYDKLREAVQECDAYYGSGGYAANLCAYAGKPVMIRSMDV